ncbi:hypothetical protein [Ekhidna sp.]
MKKILLITICAFVASLSSFAQMPQTSPLESGDVEKFIKTYDPLKKDMEALGEDFENAKDYNTMMALAANEKVQSIFKKHGWSDQYIGKLMTISMGYAIINSEKEIAKMSEEDRKESKQYMQAYMTQMKTMVTEDDLEQIKKNYDQLNIIFIKEENEDY